MRRRLHISIVWVFIIAVSVGAIDVTAKDTTTTPSLSAVEKAIDRAADYILRNTKEDGMFEYLINTDPTVTVKKRYNILRHGGTIYSMGMYYEMHPDEAMLSAIKRAGNYLHDEAVGPIAGDKNLLAVWSKPQVNRSSKFLEAKLGGAGLGLVALTSLEKFQPGFTPRDELIKLGNFILFMQKEDGSFYSKYIPAAGGFQKNWHSLYYPGEAALGLLMLYELHRSDQWAESAVNTLTYLANNRKNETKVPADHWALLATAKLLSLENVSELPIEREILVTHAAQICEVILKAQINNHERPQYIGGFTSNGRTTPTSTRLEGLLAARSILPADHALQMKIDSAVEIGIDFLLRAQISEGEYTGAFPMAVGKLKGDSERVEKFNRRVTEVRIDYVQHALSAMIQYVEHGSLKSKVESRKQRKKKR